MTEFLQCSSSTTATGNTLRVKHHRGLPFRDRMFSFVNMHICSPRVLYRTVISDSDGRKRKQKRTWWPKYTKTYSEILLHSASSWCWRSSNLLSYKQVMYIRTNATLLPHDAGRRDSLFFRTPFCANKGNGFTLCDFQLPLVTTYRIWGSKWVGCSQSRNKRKIERILLRQLWESKVQSFCYTHIANSAVGAMPMK